MGSKDLEHHDLTVSNFGFSAMGVGDLEASEYTLVTLACDASPSVEAFKRQMEACLKEILKACRLSPRADNLMQRLLIFHNRLIELHGFTPLKDLNPADTDGCLAPGSLTALNDATVNALEALASYGKTLVEHDFDVNGILFVITDGLDNHSTNTARQAREAIEKIRKEECLESLVAVLIGVNITDPLVGQQLKKFKDEVGFTQYIELDNASDRTLAKLAQFVSKSVSSQSQALGSGGPSQTLEF